MIYIMTKSSFTNIEPKQLNCGELENARMFHLEFLNKTLVKLCKIVETHIMNLKVLL